MMSEVNVTKKVTFDCAHMLSGHEALCKNLHGHTYKVLITVSGEQILTGTSAGMVIDFKHLKEAINVVIMDKFDHAVIFSNETQRNKAEEELYSWACSHAMRHFVMPQRTTAENMAVFFQQEIKKYLVDTLKLNNVKCVFAKVYETPTSYAEV